MKFLTTTFAIASLIWFGSTSVQNQADSQALSTPSIQSKSKHIALAEANFDGTSVRYFKLADGTINAILPVIEIHP